MDGMEVAIASPEGEGLPAGREGRILVRGATVTEGYFGHEEPQAGRANSRRNSVEVVGGFLERAR